jgi:hypothetical protein
VAADDASGARPPVVLRIKLRYDDVETMVQRFAPNVGRNGLFLPTKSMQPAGTEVKFELRIANDTAVLVGVGRVKHARPFDPTKPKAAFGLAVELMRVTRESRAVIIKMIERRRILGLPDVAIPMPEDAEAARRPDVESAPRADTSGIVREAMAQLASAPVSEQVLSPRRDSGPFAISKMDSRPIVAPLQPEPVKPKRPRVGDIIAKANETSGPLAALPEIDDPQLDLGKVIARARALAAATGAGDLDEQLAALRDSGAAPVEISVEGASAELARQLGGASVAKRERSAAWSPPPPVAPVTAEDDPVTPLSVAAIAPVPEPPSVPRRTEPDQVPHRVTPIRIKVEPEPPSRPSFVEREQAITEPAVPPEPEPDPATQPPMMIDDDSDLASFERALDAAIIRTGVTRAAPPPAVPDEDEPIEPPDERTQIGPMDPELENRMHEELAAAEAEAEAEFGGGMPQQAFYTPPPATAFDDEEPSEEIEEADVLAIADADDADLLLADGEHDASERHVAVMPAQESSYSFVNRLDLGDEERAAELDEPAQPQPPPRYHQPHTIRRPPTYDPPSGGYTVAEQFPPQHDDFDEPHSYGRSQYDPPSHLTPIAQPPEPAILHSERDSDLESALEQLDPNLDELAPHSQSRPVRLPGLPEPRGPRRPTEQPVQMRPRQPTPARPQPQPQPKPRLPTEDDGILIDFDDDE